MCYANMARVRSGIEAAVSRDGLLTQGYGVEWQEEPILWGWSTTIPLQLTHH